MRARVAAVTAAALGIAAAVVVLQSGAFGDPPPPSGPSLSPEEERELIALYTPPPPPPTLSPDQLRELELQAQGSPQPAPPGHPSNQPAPFPILLGLEGDKPIYVPKGGTWSGGIIEYGDPASTLKIERGASYVTIDPQEKEIIEWKVAPEDLPDFQGLREALPFILNLNGRKLPAPPYANVYQQVVDRTSVLVVERGSSRAVIDYQFTWSQDPATGYWRISDASRGKDIIEWSVAPQDTADFASIRQAVHFCSAPSC